MVGDRLVSYLGGGGVDSFPSLLDTAANNWVLGHEVVGDLAQQNWTGQNLW